MDYFKIMRRFWNWCFDNPDKIKPTHISIFTFAVEHCNRLGWKKKFGFPTMMVMEAIGVKSINTYSKALNELCEFGLIEIVEKSKNQWSANVIAISIFDEATDEALDTARIKHGIKHAYSTDTIIKHNTIYPIQETNTLVATDSDESFSTECVEVAEYLYESIIKWDSTHKYNRTKPAIKSWAKDIDKAIRIDGRDAESLKHMIHYLFNEKTQTAIFWAPNIQSGKTLREKFDIVKQKANHEHQSRKNTKGSYDPVAINETIKKALQGSQG
jgi:hypothetical protein